MKKFKVKAYCMVEGDIVVEAENIEELKKKITEKEFLLEQELPEKVEYVIDSFGIGDNFIEEINEKEGAEE